MSIRGGNGGAGRATDQRQEHTSGSVASPALQSSGGGRGPSISGGSSRGNVGRCDSKASVTYPSKEQTKVWDSDSVSALANTPAKIEPPPVRPGIGQEGMKITVRANQFLVEVAGKYLYVSVKAKKLNRGVMITLVHTENVRILIKTPAYDERKSLYTAGPFPFQQKEFLVNLEDNLLQSLRLTLSLNIYISAKSFKEPVFVTKFISKFINRRNDSKLVKVKKEMKNFEVKLLQKSAKASGISSSIARWF